MDWNSSALSPYRLRTVRIGVHVTFVTLVILALYRLLPGRGAMNESTFELLLIAAGAGALVVWKLPWEWLLDRELAVWMFYAWSAADIALISAAITVTGGPDSELFLLYALVSVFFAASYPPKGQAALFIVTVLSYLAALAVVGEGISPALLFVRIAVVAMVTYITLFLSRELLVQMVGYNRASATAKQREAWFRSLVQNASDVVCVVRATGEIQYVSPAIEKVMGYDPEPLIGQDVFQGVHPDDRGALIKQFKLLQEYPGGSFQMELRLSHGSGAWRWADATLTNLLEDSSVGGIVINYRDISERRTMEDQLRHDAFHDALTGLPNRAHFMHTAEAALADQAEASRVAFILLDLDGFKTVNDSLGHEVGDRLLVAVAERLRALVPARHTVARLGGDEFIVLATGVATSDEANALASEIANTLAHPFAIGEFHGPQPASMGIALSEDTQLSATDLLRRADLAMYAAKDQRAGRWVLYDREMSFRAEQRLEMEAALWQALERDELFLQYQPLVSLETQEITGVEALVRWRHPERGVVPPGDFITLAEETGLILPIGKWVLMEACRQARRWQDEFGDSPPLRMSVNISVRQFQQSDLAAEVAAALRATGLSADRLELEITESVLMEDDAVAMTVLQELRDLGVRLAIDDFGTGYSSLSYLRQYPIDVLKVDKSFIDGIETEDGARALVRAIISLAHTLNLVTVAEGIERSAQMEHLQALDCDSGQGFFFARPVDAVEIDKILAARTVQTPGTLLSIEDARTRRSA